ncbi:MAG: Enoyl-CoA hydratase/isomerase [Acidimicrobiia bacterium]|nr:Enoyl-CoA hydratase/isomerase [Acidimicrobiia bacterium]
MGSTQARRDEVDGVITVTFTRDEKLNAVTPEMFGVLEEAVHDLANRDDVRVLVITGEGRYFTSGIDIAGLSTNLGVGTDGKVHSSNMRRQYRVEAHHDLFDELEQIEKPIVLAAQSHCFGVGIELGVSCDFRLASDVSTFALPEVANLAVIPGSGGISRLTRLVGPHWSRWLAMAGQTVDAQQALTMGLVHAVYPAAEFAERTQAFARHLAGLPREAVGLAKIAIDTAASVDRRTAREFDRLAQTVLFASPDYRAKVEAFMSRGKR